MPEPFSRIQSYIDSHLHEMADLESLLTRHRALAPENGGDGESEKCAALEKWLIAHGITELEHYDAPDTRVSCGIRPNLVATVPGIDGSECVWVCVHLDVVPAGEETLWESDPWTAVEKDGKIYGRGTEDNQQGLASGVLAALAFVKQGIAPRRTLKLLFMADEEVGSAYGMNFLLREHGSLFSKNDRVLIPDGGDREGRTIEIAEKGILWLKFRIKGRQSHGSRPDQGCNAMTASCDLALRIHALSQVFSRKDELFEPPCCTFEPTMHLQNVSGVNIIPGEDVFCADCRILPCYSLDEVREKVREAVCETEKKYGVTVDVSELQAECASQTPRTAAVAQELFKSLKAVHGLDARFIGIGGGTVAAGLRHSGIDAVVWSSMDSCAHQPNEYAVLQNIARDAATIAFMALF